MPVLQSVSSPLGLEPRDKFLTMTIENPPAFRVLALYATTVEPDHVLFAGALLDVCTELAAEKNFQLDAVTDWTTLNDAGLAAYDVVMWINSFPQDAEQRSAFERYMENGGAWLGFHVSAYNDRHTNWPWFVDFLGGAVFYTNNWPPLPAALIVDDQTHPVTQHMPAKYAAPAEEWYMWKPSPRLNADVRVLLTLNPSNYPLGTKDLLTDGDIPVVWTNTRYNMVYINMGHSDKSLSLDIQNTLFEDAILWLGRKGDPIAAE